MNKECRLVSIIIPVYNVEKYIGRCLKSVTEQTYTKLEILIIDDGSTDNSLKICEEYKKKDERITIFHKKNGGVSSARNIGIKHATGDYLIFIDSDDYLQKEMIEQLYNNLIENYADMSVCEYFISYENGKDYRKFEKNEKKMLDKKEVYKYLLDTRYFGGFLFNKLIKKELIYNNGEIKFFDEKIHVCEDLLFICNISRNIGKVVYITQPLYYYSQRENSTLKQLYSYKRLTNYYAYLEIFKICEEESIEINKEFELRFLKFSTEALFLIRYLKINNESLKRTIYENRKKYYDKYINDKKISRKNRILIYMDFHFPYFMESLRFIKRKLKRGAI